MRALVTGADGFVGRWLVAHLESSGDQVTRLVRHQAGGAEMADLTRREDIGEVLRSARPEAIYHLAAVAFGPGASADIHAAVNVNVVGTLNLLEGCATLREPPVVMIPSSAEVYAPQATPLGEDAAVGPVNAYGATKLAQESVGLAYHHAERVPVAVIRAFNHIGPGQRWDFSVPSFARQLAAMAVSGRSSTMRVGNLSAARDFTDVRDVVRAYRLVVAGRHVGRPLNVASGRAINIGEVVKRLVQLSGVDVAIEVDASRLRTVDVPVLVGDASELWRLTSWRPRIPLETTLRDVWTDALARVRSEPSVEV
jgi:GDP-4-dehydro-6-deoxy-D-mannose reductase